MVSPKSGKEIGPKVEGGAEGEQCRGRVCLAGEAFNRGVRVHGVEKGRRATLTSRHEKRASAGQLPACTSIRRSRR
jgi:hypothetical protein